jgi:hypothetical protein
MAETKEGKKYVVVEPYKKADGTKVGKHFRSTPEPPAPRPTRRGR